MMKKIITNGFLLILLVTATGSPAAGQKTVKLIPSESKIVIEGTSSLHDWEEVVEKFDVSMQFQSQGADVESISNVKFLSKSASVVSDNSIMTGKTHDALQVEKFPEIVFRSTEPAVLELNGERFTGILTGDLILNGNTKPITIKFSGTLTGDRIEVTGSHSLNMSDYNIKSPTAMLGALKTGDRVRVSFALKFRIG